MGKGRINELRLSLLIIVLITMVYALVAVRSGSITAPSTLGGQALGIAGLTLMLVTETLYSLRKRMKEAARWGRMETWFKFHIVTGLVGPYLVLLHTTWKFNGLAGVVTLLTLLIVISGLIGRYIYTSIPRTPAGVEMSGGDLDSLITTNDAELRQWRASNTVLCSLLPLDLIQLTNISSHDVWSLLFGRAFSHWKYQIQWWQTRLHLKGANLNELRALQRIVTERQELQYKAATWVIQRRALALWHSVHVPLGITLFTTAFIHIGAAIYYVVLFR